MTQAIGIQPVLTLFPALALNKIAKFPPMTKDKGRRTLLTFVLFLFGGTAVTTAHDYFNKWAIAPEVRVQYESTMAAAMGYLNEHDVQGAAISTITPGEFHTPALAKMMLTDDAAQPHWFNGRSSLLLPKSEESIVIMSGYSELHSALRGYFETAVLATTVPLHETDKDYPLEVYRWNRSATVTDWQTRFTFVDETIQMDDALHFLGYDLQTPLVANGDLIRVATLWQIEQPVLMETRLFTHLLTTDGNFVAQQDLLNVPSESWQAGDWFIQLHEFELPKETDVGEYTLVVGGYSCPKTCEKGVRFPIIINGQPAGDTITIQPLIVK